MYFYNCCNFPHFTLSHPSISELACLAHFPWCHFPPVFINISYSRLWCVGWCPLLVRRCTVLGSRHHAHCTRRRSHVVANILHRRNARLSRCVRNRLRVLCIWTDAVCSRRSNKLWCWLVQCLGHRRRRHFVVQISWCRSSRWRRHLFVLGLLLIHW